MITDLFLTQSPPKDGLIMKRIPVMPKALVRINLTSDMRAKWAILE